jgi:hypothetical protein
MPLDKITSTILNQLMGSSWENTKVQHSIQLFQVHADLKTVKMADKVRIYKIIEHCFLI